jgi:hypothetical protein
MTGPAEGDPAEHGRSPRRVAYLTVAAGAAHALLFLASYGLLLSVPGARAPDAEIVSFYGSGESRRLLLVGLYLMPFAGIAFIWFIVSLRMWIAAHVRRENALLSNIQLVSGIVYLSLFFATAAASAATAAAVEFTDADIDPTTARLFPRFGAALLLVFGMRMAAMFVFTTSNIGRGARVLPRWFIFLGYAVGLFLLLSATFSPLLALVFPVWLLALCALLFVRARRIPAEATIPPIPGRPAPRATAPREAES